jgi:NADPH:quinone reductase-like Zn-dependent oxidoreductase
VVDAGTVIDLPVGSSVYGLVPFDRDGAAAQYVAVPASSLALKPPELSDVIAAAAPMTTLTALQALTVHAGCKPGDRVLVHGAAGSVGGLVTQLGKSLGAHVTGTARARDRHLVLDLGADTVLDYETESFDARPDRYDIVVDTVGGDTLDRSYPVVRPGGHLVTLQAPPSQQKADQFGITATFFIVTADRTQLTEIANLIRDRQLRITVSETYPLADGAQAYLSGAERNRPTGKTVLLIDR